MYAAWPSRKITTAKYALIILQFFGTGHLLSTDSAE
jgi:hypothetical protein